MYAAAVVVVVVAVAATAVHIHIHRGRRRGCKQPSTRMKSSVVVVVRGVHGGTSRRESSASVRVTPARGVV